MEVAIPSNMDFDFGSVLSAPSSPRRFGQCFLSAPTSPARLSDFYRQFDEFSMAMERSQSRNHSVSAVPFDWEEKPGTPKSPKSGTAFPATVSGDEFGFDFAFDVSAESEMASRSAEELFDCGKIRPLTPPPRLQFPGHGDHLSPKSSLISSPRSPRSPVAQGKKFFRDVFSPRRKKQSDPFAAVVKTEEKTKQDDSGFLWEEEEAAKQQYQKQSIMSNEKSSSTGSSSLSSSSSLKGSSKKWRFKDFLLFRSASEGRGSDKDHLRKYGTLFKKQEEVRNSSFRSTASDVKNSSFRSTESTGSRRRVSAHELHYTANKAVSEDLKKKTFLPYKQGILGRLAFNPAVHALANGFGSLGRS